MKKIILIMFILLGSAGNIYAQSDNINNYSTINQTSNVDTLFASSLYYVYRHNPKLNAERENLKISDEHVSQAVSGFRPNLTATGAAGRQRESVAGEDWLYGSDTEASLIAIQPVFNGFGTLAQYHAAKERVEAGRAKLLVTEQGVLLESINGWLELCEKQQVVLLTYENWKRMYSYWGATEQRFKSGDGTRTDIAQSSARVAEAEAHYDSAVADLEAARSNYERVTGLRAPEAGFPSMPAGLPASAQEAENLARNHPELAQAQKEEDAADHDIESASSSLWPSVFIRGAMNEQRSPELGLDRLRDDSVTLNVSMPLYQGGAEYSRIREAKLVKARVREASFDAWREAIARARQSWANYYAACKIIDASHRASDSASLGLKGVEIEQAQGTRTTLDVLNAQSELLRAQLSEIQAQKNAELEAYKLLASIGRLTAQDLRLGGPYYNPNIHYDNNAARLAGVN